MFRNLDQKHRTTRTRQLELGALIATDSAAAAAGFTCAVDLTRQAWSDAVRWDGDPRAQNEGDRLRAVLDAAFVQALGAAPGATRVPFSLDRVPNAPGAAQAEAVTLTLTMSRGDADEAVATIRPQTDY